MAAETAKGGRPAVGPQVSFAISGDDDKATRALAEKTGRTLADIRRGIYTAGLPAFAQNLRREDSSEFVQPAAWIIADWIAAPGEQADRRERFLRYYLAAHWPLKSMAVLMHAAGELAADGATIPLVPAKLTERLGARNGYAVRGQLFFTVMAELGQRGITVGGAEGLPDPETSDPETSDTEPDDD